MSKELDELRRMARNERKLAWEHAKLVPARIGDTASAFAKRHPILAMGGAAALTMSMLTRRQRRAGGASGPKSMPMAMAAMGVQFLPDLLRLVGLTVPKPADDDAIAGTRHEPCEVPTNGVAHPTASGSGPKEHQQTREPL
jgi:hypothetical protein